MQQKKQQIQNREELIYALCRAAEIEHGLTCIYLFTAFSMKKFLVEGIDEIQRDKIRNWQGLIFSVARQEMEHLGLVCNLLNAIGGAQHFSRPNLPQPADYYSTVNDFALKTFSLETMAEFMNFEKPANSTDVHAEVEAGNPIVPTPFIIHNHHTVQELYETIREGFAYLDEELPGELFIGPPEAQVDGEDIDVGFDNSEFGITMIKINNLQDAFAAIDEIVEQGEGVILGDPAHLDPRQQKAKALYLLLDKNVKALAEQSIEADNWPKALHKLIRYCGSINTILRKSKKLFEASSDDIALLDSMIERISTAQAKLKALRERPFSKPNQRKANAARQDAYNPANYEAEGLLLAQFIEADCHYLKFWEIYLDIKANHFEAGRHVVNNPMLRLHDDNRYSKDVFIVSQPYTQSAMALFNAGYETMVQMLLLFFTYSNMTANERTMLMRTAFFPLMTMFTRPLGQTLTLLPADKDFAQQKHPFRAGPSFEYYSNIALLAHQPPNWIYLHERLLEMAELAQTLTTIPKKLTQWLRKEQLLDEVQDQMTYLATNIQRMADNFASGMQLTDSTTTAHASKS
ncbi:MAG: ferritin-like domain-containing protein [Bacteroidota bacterium]